MTTQEINEIYNLTCKLKNTRDNYDIAKQLYLNKITKSAVIAEKYRNAQQDYLNTLNDFQNWINNIKNNNILNTDI